ncbi:Permease of the drug/metabolite transporter (DMT) superfamily [Cupriavidus sp. U2]|uniref:Abi family protein n=1 Tax=Cupriavidus sp. U2 TaxID=2920269 RepID=UPI00129EEAF8|nr:Abi family protein [Cupriavidus sp. U2]KAI3593946.1 Permease of the drug/metabolite transporter (DMT) superfamily [Cupriavidus sp. U2]
MLHHFAVPRLSAVERFFSTRSYKDLIGAYCWNQAVSAALLPILGDFEVALRNALHRALSQYCGGTDSAPWMTRRDCMASSGDRKLDAYHRLSPRTQQDIEAAIAKKKGSRGGDTAVTPDDIVAGLSFGFWEQLVKGLGHPSHPPDLQAIVLRQAFPYAPETALTPHGSKNFRERLVRLLARVRDIRNRIGHHEALWACPEFDLHGNVGFIPRRPRHTVASLSAAMERVSWIAGWISPKVANHIRATDHWCKLRSLLSRHALATYRTMGGTAGTYRRVLDALSEASEVSNHRSRRYPSPASKRRRQLAAFHF